MKKGDKVRVPKWMAIGGYYNRGVVTYVNGANVLVKLNFKGVICHLYLNELTQGWR
jgi:hypothetical protein